MRESIERTLFREPEGVGSGAVWLALAAGLFGYSAFLLSRLDSDPTLPVVLGTALACFGAAEILPEKWGQWAGWLRLLGVIIAISIPFVAF